MTPDRREMQVSRETIFPTECLPGRGQPPEAASLTGDVDTIVGRTT